jgi:hypothetical protein
MTKMEAGMKLLLATLAVMVSTAALADGKFTCNFVGEEKGTKVWQCAPPPGWTAVGGQQPNTVPDNKK